jgi:hypothetical protein
MATYLPKQEYTITRIEGNDCDFVVVVPNLFPLAGITACQFKVEGSNDELIFNKTMPTITIASQTITIPIAATDTANKNGKYRWELQTTIGGKITTIGLGDFILINKVI